MLLNELFDFLPKSNRPASYGKSEGKYPFFNSSNIIDKFVDDPDYSGEFLIIGDGGTGNCKYYNGKFSATDHTYLLKPKKNTNCKLIKYFLEKDNYKILNDGFKGVGIKNVSKSYIQNIEFKKSKKYTDQIMLDVLDSINKLINDNEKHLILLDELIKSRFIEMFDDPISNDKCWLTKDLNEITDVRDGTHDSPKYRDSGYPFVTSKNLINGKIDFSTCQLISEEDYLHFNDRSCVDDGDILMPMIGTIGGAIMVKKDREFAIKNVALIKFNKDNSIINRTFILNILNSDSMNEYFNNIKKGGTQNFISLGLIRKIPIIVPPIELQNEFASFVEQIDKSKFIYYSKYFL